MIIITVIIIHETLTLVNNFFEKEIKLFTIDFFLRNLIAIRKKGESMNLKNKPLAMAYVPWQMFDEVMDGCGGLAHGTIFEELVFPFVGSQAACQSRRYCDLNGRNTMENRSSCPCGRGRSFR